MAKYTPNTVKKICSLMQADKYTIKEICYTVGICEDTFYEWKKIHPEFLNAIKDAEEKRFELFKQEAHNGLLSLLRGREYEEETIEYVEGKNGKPTIKNKKRTKKIVLPNATSIIFTLKNLDKERFGEKEFDIHTGGVTVQIGGKQLDDE